MENSKIVEELNKLMVINYDAKNGYLNAKETTDSPSLKKFFNVKFEQRSKFLVELHEAITYLGGTPVDGGSVVGNIHRSWMDLKALVTGKDEEAILDTCETGEEVAISVYDEVIKTDGLSTDLVNLISKQRWLITQSLRKVEKLEASYS